MGHKPTIKDDETNYGPQTKEKRRRDKLWSTSQRLKTKRQIMVHKPTIKDEETNYGPQTND
jgi:hypothetical protein